MEIEMRDIKKDLEFLKEAVKEIKEKMTDVDVIMTEEDYESILKAREEKLKGELTSLDNVKKELGL